MDSIGAWMRGMVALQAMTDISRLDEPRFGPSGRSQPPIKSKPKKYKGSKAAKRASRKHRP